jgi:endonuclease/exonuclease/phosphatase family metal-dependent hydrolase
MLRLIFLKKMIIVCINSGQMQVSIFSYNIRGLPFLPDSWTEPLSRWFNGCAHDIVCLQEVFTQGRINMTVNSLQNQEYTVLKPNDFLERKNLMGSGLITAVKTNIWEVRNDGFVAFLHFTGAENLANKGFHWIHLKNKMNACEIMIINTHLQADNPCNYLSGCIDPRPIRRRQSSQIIDFLKHGPKIRHIIIGDLNSESEPHEEIKYLTGSLCGVMKHTFEPTGEDLDHVAILDKLWLWKMPIIKEISVLTQLWWSDHWPLHVILYI